MAKLISIGISEGVTLSKESGIDEEGRMRIVMDINPSAEELVQAMLEGKTIEVAKSSFVQFLPNMEIYGGKGPKSHTDLVAEFMKFRDMLLDYGELVSSKETANTAFGGLRAFIAIGVAPEAVASVLPQFTQETFLSKVYASQFKLFTDFLATIPNLEEIKFRHKFWRGSKKKTFSAIPSRGGVPYVELATVPIAKSSISWSVWELENGKNDATEVAADKSADVADVPAANAMFEAPGMVGPDLVAPGAAMEAGTPSIM